MKNTHASWANMKKIVSSSGLLALGEGFARICNFTVIVLISRCFGVSSLGAFALAQTVAIYLILGIDMGMRHIGASLIAKAPESIGNIVRVVQRKRLILALVFVPVGVLYGAIGPVPADARPMVVVFSISTALYAFSVDWVAWGMQKYIWLGFWRTLISIGLLIAVLLCRIFKGSLALWLGSGNALAYASGAIILSVILLRGKRRDTIWGETREAEVLHSTAWIPVFWMGIALACNQVFNNIDSLLLGAMSNTHEVGLYNASYRLLFSMLAIYYLLTQAVFPGLAKMDKAQHSLRSLAIPILIAGAIGIALAGVIFVLKRNIIVGIYGSKFSSAGHLLGILIWALPMDFVTSFIGNAMVAWGYSKRVLMATGTAAFANIGLNSFFIPRYGASGAAWVTLCSYVVLLGIFVFVTPRRSAVEHVLGAL